MKVGRAIRHEILVKPSDNFGYIVKVGCRVFTYSDPSELIQDLRDCLADPARLEKRVECELHDQVIEGRQEAMEKAVLGTAPLYEKLVSEGRIEGGE